MKVSQIYKNAGKEVIKHLTFNEKINLNNMLSIKIENYKSRNKKKHAKYCYIMKNLLN